MKILSRYSKKHIPSGLLPDEQNRVEKFPNIAGSYFFPCQAVLVPKIENPFCGELAK